jgi:hypothetical protein
MSFSTFSPFGVQSFVAGSFLTPLSFDVQSSDVDSFDVQSFVVESFDIQLFGVRSFDVQ